ncbi:MAG: LPS-assembly protein LptD [Burkholderiaceae bacterium]|nr:MAG: LPS-assembly protein LptD [Burkholderiaceae bacterium]
MASVRGRQSAIQIGLAAALLAQLGPALAQAASEATAITAVASTDAASVESGPVSVAPAQPQETANEESPELSLRIQQEFLPQHSDTQQPPIFASADRMEGATERSTHMFGHVVMRQGQQSLKADDVLYQQESNEALAKGDVRLYRNGDRYEGPELKLQIDTGAGYFLAPRYRFFSNNGQGQAQRIDFIDTNRMKMTDALYSTCPPEQKDWYLKAGSIETDKENHEGVARNTVLYFKDMPVLWTPVFTFPLDDARKSGFLSPSFGATTKGGAEFTLPYYWNIAPNHDMTLYPKFISRRGAQLGAEVRYLDPRYSGQVRFEYLPNDSLANRDRSTYSIKHNGVLPGNVALLLDLNRASDDQYFRDFSHTISDSSQLFLPNTVQLAYGASWWNATVRSTRYQTLQDPLAPVVEPYNRAPQFTWNAAKQDVHGFDLAATTDYTRFTHSSLVEGDRFVAMPSLSLPWLTPGFYVKPKITWHYTHYNLSQEASGTQSNFTRTVPIYSLDAGMVFERDIRWFDAQAQQTLEPRLFYLKVPYRNQDALPNFDSGVADFNFAQIFSENAFSGYDRVGDANQLTAAVISRVLDAQTGSQIARVALAQRFSYEPPQVFLPGQSQTATRRSDFLLAATGQISPALLLDTGLQYNPSQRRAQKSSIGLRYQPAKRKVINATYRYTRDLLEQFDVSGQWPLSRTWSGVARFNYSMRESRLIESAVGLEHDSCCWILRLAAQRFAVGTQNVNTAFFVQLEFKGMGGLGTSPKEMLLRNVPGYTPLDAHLPARTRPLTEDDE